jgi:hypothetical protein
VSATTSVPPGTFDVFVQFLVGVMAFYSGDQRLLADEHIPPAFVSDSGRLLLDDGCRAVLGVVDDDARHTTGVGLQKTDSGGGFPAFVSMATVTNRSGRTNRDRQNVDHETEISAPHAGADPPS